MHNLIKLSGILALMLLMAAFTFIKPPSLPAGAPEVGQQAPEIALPGPDGKVIKLSSLKGKVVLIDFWASWCGPCRKQNPYVVEMYQAYKDKGFTIYSVSLDQNKNSWTKAIQKDGLEWENHVSDLKFWNNKAAADYGVDAIPATFLIDRNGMVIAKNLHGGELDKQIKKALKK